MPNSNMPIIVSVLAALVLFPVLFLITNKPLTEVEGQKQERVTKYQQENQARKEEDAAWQRKATLIAAERKVRDEAAKETYAKYVGTTQELQTDVRGCPGWAPDTPTEGLVRRIETQIREGQCQEFKSGDDVVIEKYHSGLVERACLRLVGSIKPCQWVNTILPMHFKLEPLKNQVCHEPSLHICTYSEYQEDDKVQGYKLNHPENQAVPGVWHCPGRPDDPTWCYPALPVSPNETVMNELLEYERQNQNWSIAYGKGVCFVSPDYKVTVTERRAATSVIKAGYIGSADGNAHVCSGVVPNDWVHF
jgi:hypothetical protein